MKSSPTVATSLLGEFLLRVRWMGFHFECVDCNAAWLAFRVEHLSKSLETPGLMACTEKTCSDIWQTGKLRSRQTDVFSRPNTASVDRTEAIGILKSVVR